MARNMSFMLTTDQIRDQSKTVTRRLGWWQDKNGRALLRKGDLLHACVKCMGLRPGEKIDKICQIRVVSIRRELLNEMWLHPYGKDEAAKEGFPAMSGPEFVSMFCKHMSCPAAAEVTRIEFEYVNEPAGLIES